MHHFVPWQDRARCRDYDPEVFFPEKGGSSREAKRICAECPVRIECLNYALRRDERYGVWGGMSERERRRLKRMASWPSRASRARCAGDGASAGFTPTWRA